MNRLSHKILLFLGIVFSLSVWIPLLVFGVSLLLDAPIGLGILIYWFLLPITLLGWLGMDTQGMLHGFTLIGPTPSGLFATILFWTVIGLILWVVSKSASRRTPPVWKDPADY